MLNAKVAIKLFRKLGLNNITHAKDGIEGKPYEILILIFKALEACDREKFDLCFMGISSSCSNFLNARSPDASYTQIQVSLYFTIRDGRIECYKDTYNRISGEQTTNRDRHDGQVYSILALSC